MFEIINNSGFDVDEVDILQSYIECIVKKLKIDGAIFNVIMVDDDEEDNDDNNNNNNNDDDYDE